MHFDTLLLTKAYKDLNEKVQESYISLKSGAKFEEKLNHGSKNKVSNLGNFSASTSKSENFHFDVLLLSVAYKVSAKEVQTNYLMTLKKDPNFEEEECNFCLKNGMRNLVNFNESSGNYKNLHFDGTLW